MGWGDLVNAPESIRPHDRHEILRTTLQHPLSRETNPRIREKHIQPPIQLQTLVHDGLDVGLAPGVHASALHFDARVQGGDFAFVRVEVRGAEVAEEDGVGAVAGELVGGGAADAEGAVGAGYGDDFVFDAAGRGVLVWV